MSYTAQYTLQDLKKYKIAILCGGESNEREVSLTSGECIYEAVKSSNLNLDVTKIDPARYNLLNLSKDGYNLVFNTLHGRNGEDGKIQGFLDVLGIKYTGVGAFQSSITLNKVMTKKIWQNDEVATPTMATIDSKQFLSNPQKTHIEEIISKIGMPVFVKPNLEGSSIGITKAETLEAVFKAVEVASKIDETVIIEKFINGKEYSVPVLNGVALAAIEIIPDLTKHIFYDYEAKYNDDNTRYECPANLSTEDTTKILQLAEKASKSFNIKSWCRVDILSDQNNNFYALEINTNPGMTTHSLFPMAAKIKGLSYQDLCLKVLLDAINNIEER